MSIYAIIPARGGSKGIPGKNILEIAGKPLIAYSIFHGMKSKLIDRVIVSTDDKKIADIAKNFGADVPFIRPSDFAQDMSPDIDVFQHVLEWLDNNEKSKPELVVHLRPTSPVRQIVTIDKAIEKMLNFPQADSLISVSLALQTPYKMWRIKSNEFMEKLLTIDNIDDCQSMPRQKLPKTYWQNGYVDVIRTDTIIQKKTMKGNKVIPFLIDENIFELDYPEDIIPIEEFLSNNNPTNSLARSNALRHSV